MTAQASHSHADRIALAHAALARGHSADAQFTKTFSKTRRWSPETE